MGAHGGIFNENDTALYTRLCELIIILGHSFGVGIYPAAFHAKLVDFIYF
jgi:hypothetical protein